ncbi:hypothetical protein KTR10_02960 [Candidatus Kaiserbacteria bacterium]|nr:hypothetical protein [Candidatus Kaiserbacteria bacterium]
MYQDVLVTFREDSLPDLDTVVLGALEYFEDKPSRQELPAQDKKVLVLGSEGAAVTGRLLYEDRNAVFADESTYEETYEAHPDIEAVVVISASGSKHAPEMVKYAKERGSEVFLLTTAKSTPAEKLLDTEHVLVFPRLREPYTYNVSTYMGMLLSKTKEDAGAIKQHVETVLPALPENFGSFDAFCLIIPPQFDSLRGLLLAKFDELFGPRISARVFTTEQMKHAKTVVPSPTECFISFGERNKVFGTKETRLHIPLREHAGIVDLMAMGYAIIGRIQNQLPPYFKDNIEVYVKEASRLFNTKIKVIVE